MTTLIEEYRRLGLLAFELNFNAGSLRDSVSGNVGTVTAPVIWGKSRKIRGISCSGNGLVTYPDTTANRLAGGSGTIIVVGSFRATTTNQRFFSKRDAGSGAGPYLEFASNSATTLIGTFANASIPVFTCNYNGARLLAMTFVDGTNPKCYVDGNPPVIGSVASINPSTTAPINIGNIYPVTATPSISLISRVIGISRALSPAEIARCYEELTATVSSTKVFVKDALTNAVPSKAIQPTALQLHWALNDAPNNVVLDLSGRGRNGTSVGTGRRAGLFGTEAVSFKNPAAFTAATSYVTLSNGLTTIAGSNDSHSLSLWFKYGTTIPAYFFILGGSAVTYFVQVEHGANKYINWTTQFGTQSYSIGGSLVPGLWYHLFLQKISATNGECYLNNNKLSIAAGNLIAMGAAPGNLNVGCYGNPATASNHFIGEMQDLRFYSTNLKRSEISDLYYAGAKRLRFSLPMKNEVEVTLADVTAAGAPIGNTPFKVLGGGTWRVTEPVPGKKYIINAGAQNVAAGIESKQAFGTWVFDVFNPPGAVSEGCWWHFIANNITDISSAAREGYMLGIYSGTVILYNLIPGPGANTLFSNTACVARSTYYQLAVTRTFAGIFSIYIKGGTYKVWTLIPATGGSNPTAINITYTTSVKCLLAAVGNTSNGGFGAMRFYEGVLTTQQLQELA